MRLKVGERPHLWMFSFGSARNCRSKSFLTSPKGRRGPGPCAGTHTVRPPSVRMRPDAGIGPCWVRASPCLCVGGGACPRPPVPGLRCAAGVISRPARAIESLWRKNAPSSVTASPCHLPPRGGKAFRVAESRPFGMFSVFVQGRAWPARLQWQGVPKWIPPRRAESP